MIKKLDFKGIVQIKSFVFALALSLSISGCLKDESIEVQLSSIEVGNHLVVNIDWNDSRSW